MEARFLNLTPILQQMFLKLDSMDKGEEKYSALKTLLMEFIDVAKEVICSL